MATEIEVTDEATAIEVTDGTSTVEIINASADIEAITVESLIEITTIGPTVTTVFGKLNRLITTTQTINEFEVLLQFNPFIENGATIIINGTDPETAGVFFLL